MSLEGQRRKLLPFFIQNHQLIGNAMDSQTTYNYKVVRQFTVMTVVWGIVGMLVGVIIAAQLVWPQLGFDLPWLAYGRLRPLHTNAVIFAFGGSALFATSYYVVQRTCQTRLFSDGLAAFTFWGWMLVIVLAAVTLPLGITTSKEYAELEWPIDILITLVWVSYAIVFFGTIVKRRVKHIYVANWFYGAFILTVAVLHLVNSAALPVSITKSYSVYSGAIDAMVQWWYGHNAVGFFLTAGFLGMMYYFVPKQAGRPVYSYRLSVVHFWALISTYMWAGPHHLHYTALPVWAQSLGMVFSLILLAPSWGGMINGIMTLSGAWHKLRTDPILKFLIVSLSFYGMSTFEGPMMSIKTVNALSHYTDWTIGHVHSGALGWVAMVSIGCVYFLIPKLFGREQMYSIKLIDWHFWMSTIGVVLYIVAMWIAGVMQGLMWRAVNDDGTLTYSFVESLEAMYPFYFVRLLGGSLFLIGMLVMAYNVIKTVSGAKPAEAAIPQTA
jgi:cytochrome c oxidase cbb3-type subunit 1